MADGTVYVIVVGVGAIVLSLVYIIIYERRKRVARNNSAIAQEQISKKENEKLLPKADSFNHVIANEISVVSNGHIKTVPIDKKQEYLRQFEEIKCKYPDMTIKFEHLEVKEIIGKGQYGDVKKAIYTSPDGVLKIVACKFLKPGKSGVKDLFNEGSTMIAFNHPNVINLIGMSYPSEGPIVITEFMPHGNLLAYIKDATKDPSVQQLLQFAIQIAKGMEYLHSVAFVHRDLAARNCMLGESEGKLTVKIGDFGLSRKCEKNLTYVQQTDRPLPVEWLAMEALEEGLFTAKGDVWAYGVLLWELMTFGMRPYSDMGWKTEEFVYKLKEYLGPKENRRLEQPEFGPPELYDEVMVHCWAIDQSERPSFTQILTIIENIDKNNQ